MPDKLYDKLTKLKDYATVSWPSSQVAGLIARINGAGTLQPLPIVGTRSNPLAYQSGNRLGGGDGNTGLTTRSMHLIPGGATTLRAVFGNQYNTSTSTVAVANTNSITVKAAVEYSVGSLGTPGTIYPVYFNGSRTVTIPPGQFAIHDPLPIEIVPGSQIAYRTYVTVTTPASEYFPVALLQVGGVTEGRAANSDVVDSGAVTSSNSLGYSPMMILGTPKDTRLRSILLAGDSIMQGVGHEIVYPWVGVGLYGIMGGHGHLWLPLGGEGLDAWQSTNRHRNGLLAVGCDYAIFLLGANDVQGTTLALMKSKTLDIASTILARGTRKIWWCTVTPRSSSTDSWATATNQTPDALGTTVRQGFNDWLRDTSASGFVTQAGGSNVAGVFDVAAQVEVDVNNNLSTSGGRWLANGTSVGLTGDGLHPNYNGVPYCSAPIAAAAVAGDFGTYLGTYVADSFARSDSSSSLGTTESGSLSWSAQAGTWGVASGKAYSSAGTDAQAVVDPGVGYGGIVKADVTYQATGAGLVFRGTDANNFYLAAIETTRVALYKRVSGTYTLLTSTSYTPSTGTTYAVRIEYFGNAIRVFVNGVRLISTTDSTYITQTKCGLRTLSDTASRFDSFSYRT